MGNWNPPPLFIPTTVTTRHDEHGFLPCGTTYPVTRRISHMYPTQKHASELKPKVRLKE
jgi:hypothetical protein